MKKLFFGYLFIAFGLFPQTLLSQLFGLPHLERYTSSNGLINNSVVDILQDSLGFLWIATVDGLNRFDGNDFTAYRREDRQPGSLPGNWLSSLSLSPKGALWIGTQKEGLCQYDYASNTFENLKFQPLDQASDYYIHPGKTILVDEEDRIWLGMEPGIIQVDLGSDTTFTVAEGGNLIVQCFYKTKDGRIWAGTTKGLFLKENTPNSKFQLVHSIPVDQTGRIRSLLQTSSNHLLIGAAQGLFAIDLSSSKGLNQPQLIGSFKEVNSLVCDRENQVWVGSQEGLGVIDGNSFTINPNAARTLHKHKLDRQYVTALYLDREDNLWVGTVNNGLIRLFLSGSHFPVFHPNIDDADAGVLENITCAYMEQDGIIWLGTFGAGLIRFDRRNMRYENFKFNPDDSYSLNNNTIYSIYRDHENRLWIGTWWDGGINEVVEENGKVKFLKPTFVPLDDAPKPKNFFSIQKIFEDKEQNLWVASNNGLIKKPKGDSKFYEEGGFDLPFASINDILEDKEGNWWIGTWNGLFVYNHKKVALIKKRQHQYSFKPDALFYADWDKPGALKDNRITCLHQDQKGRIWVSTNGGGLYLWEGTSPNNFEEKFKHYGHKDGLQNEAIYGILEDPQNRLWLSTNNGLILFNPNLEVMQTFTHVDGLQSNQFNLHAFNYTPTGEFIFGGVNGFNIFNPLEFSTQPPALPEVLLTDIQIQGQHVPIGPREDGSVVRTASMLNASSITISPKDNNFRLFFSTPTFNNATKLRYAYKLEGFDENWQYTDHNNRSATYSNLFEGTYQFKIKSSIDGMNWSPIKVLQIIATPPWYRTWWAYLLFVLLLIGAFALVAWLSYIYFNLQNKLKLEQIQRHKEAEKHELKLWFFTYISHEFRTPLTLILSPLSEMVKDTNLPSNIRKKLNLTYFNSQRLLRLVNQILNFRMANVDKLKLAPQKADLVSFAQDIFQSFETYAETRAINFEFKSQKPLFPIWFDKEKMELILYNLITNAFKYSPKGGKIELAIEETEEHPCIICVRDQGVGINKKNISKIFEPFYRVKEGSNRGFGIGLSLVKDLVELHNGEIKVKSEEGRGSEFQVILPTTLMDVTDIQADKEELFWPSKDISILPKDPIPSASDLQFFKGANTKKRVILFVEDDHDIRMYFKQHFEKDFQILEANNGREGLKLAKSHHPDIIISDITMPEMDGFTLCNRLKNDLETSHIPIILLTAKTNSRSQLKGFQSGAIEYITKPINIDLLSSRVFALLNNLQLLRDHYKHNYVLPANSDRNAGDENFVLQAAQCIEEHMNQPTFNANEFAAKLGISRSGLHRKLIALTGKSTTQFIRFVRLKKAERLLQEGNHNVSQTAYLVGFNDLKYFRKCFKEEFNRTPSELIRKKKGMTNP